MKLSKEQKLINRINKKVKDNNKRIENNNIQRHKLDEEFKGRIDFFTIMTIVSLGFTLLFLTLYTGEHYKFLNAVDIIEHQDNVFTSQINQIVECYRQQQTLQIENLKIMKVCGEEIMECKRDLLNNAVQNLSISVSVNRLNETTFPMVEPIQTIPVNGGSNGG